MQIQEPHTRVGIPPLTPARRARAWLTVAVSGINVSFVLLLLLLPLALLGYCILEYGGPDVRGQGLRALYTTLDLRVFVNVYIVLGSVFGGLHRWRACRDVMLATAVLALLSGNASRSTGASTGRSAPQQQSGAR
jgi:hypothetical protein